MKRLIPIYAILFGLGHQMAWACDLCKKTSPKVLKISPMDRDLQAIWIMS